MVRGEMIFYCGVAAIIVAVVIGIAVFFIFKIRFSALNRQLDQEYGKQEKKNESVQSGAGG